MQNKGSLHNKFEGFGTQPSEKLWDSIASNLDQKKKRRAIIFWWLGSGLAAGIIVLFSVLFVNGSNDFSAIKTTVNQTNHIDENGSSEKNSIVLEDNVQISNSFQDKSNNSTETNIDDFNHVQQNLSETIVNNTPTKSDDLNIKSQLTIQNTNKGENQDIKKLELVINEREKSVVDKFKNSIIPQLNIERNTEHSLSEIAMPKLKPQWLYSFNIQSQKGFTLFNETEANFAESASNNFDLPFTPYAIKTFRPVTLRFGVAKQLKKRLSFQTGIDLGWIQTNDIISESSLFTIGIPLKLNLTLIDRKRGAFYADFGLVNEIPMFEITRQMNGGYYNSVTSKIAGGFLGGTELGLGFNYKINENLKFDVNSGLKWYYYQSVKNVIPPVKQNTFITFKAGVIWNY